MKYGLEKETYENMDEIFNNIGGKVSFDSSCNGKATDNGFYCWLRKNIIKTPRTFPENVKTINEAIKLSFDECSASWKKECFIPTIDDKINLQVSIDDMGEFSIFCTEYELGQSVTSGDVVYMNGSTYTAKPGSSGYRYDPIFREMFIKKTYNSENGKYTYEDWNNYTNTYINDNSEYFDTNYAYYGFKTDGTKVSGDSEQDVKDKLVTYYPIVEKFGVLINGDIYPINKEEHVEYNSKTYYVFREKDTQTPYTFINGKKVYAALNTNNVSEIGYKFSFADKIFGRTRTTASELEEYISYNGCNYTFNASGNIEIDGIEYYKIDGYFNTENETLYYKTVGSTTTVYRWYAMEMQIVDGYTLDGNAFVKKDDNPVVYTTGKITGYTTSKLEKLRSTDALVDDAGYELPGKYNVGENKNHQPSEGTELELLYEVGNTANIMPYKKTQTLEQLIDVNNPNKDKNWFIGDIITTMRFYYKGINGKKYIGDTEGTKNWATSSLKTIQSVSKPTTMTLESENIFCDITYLIGATLERTANNKFSVYTDGNSGVTYNETVEFEKKNVEYHLKAENSKSTPMEKKGAGVHSLSYPVVCYVIKQNEVEIDGEIKYVDNTAIFSSDSFKCQNGSVKTYSNDMVTSETGIFPILRREYMFGSAIMQNVDANIYIDRGINAALDKHLKLGEVTSMEALENYSNGYFKMMNN
jgi:hypothetical protein